MLVQGEDTLNCCAVDLLLHGFVPPSVPALGCPQHRGAAIRSRRRVGRLMRCALQMHPLCTCNYIALTAESTHWQSSIPAIPVTTVKSLMNLRPQLLSMSLTTTATKRSRPRFRTDVAISKRVALGGRFGIVLDPNKLSGCVQNSIWCSLNKINLLHDAG